MAYNATYSFTSLAANEDDFTWDGPDVDVLSAENTDGAWCWTDDGSTSSSTGPPSGTACVYTETSSPVTVDDEFIMTLATANEVNASLYSLYVEFDTCVQGNTDGQLIFEAYDGSTWNEIDSWLGDAVTTMVSQGPYDLTAYTNTDFSIRFRVIVGSASQTYHNDFAVTDINIYGDDKVTDPVITDVGTDEDVEVGETGVTITGSTFETEGANSRVRIDSSSAGTGTSQTQTDTSWSDTSIDFTCSLGSLSYGTNYLFVRNNSLDENATGYQINLYAPLSTSSMSDSTIYNGQTSVTVNGSGFGATQSSSTVLLGSASDGSGTNVSQTITNWTDTAITFTVSIGALSLGTAYIIVSRNNSSLGDSLARLTNSQTVTLEAVPSVPVITNADDENFIENESNVIIEGSGFGSTQGTGNCQLCPSATYSSGSAVTQTINTWANGELDIDIVRGALSLGFNYLFILNDDGYRNTTGYAVSLIAAASSDGIYKTSNIQSTVTSKGLTITTFLISDE